MTRHTCRSRTEWFFGAAALLLLLASAAKAYSITGTAKILSISDQYLHINNRLLMGIVAFIEAALALYLLGSRKVVNRATALVWLSSNFMFYRIAHSALGITSCPCLGTL